MRKLCKKIDQQKGFLTTVIFTLSLIILQGLYSNAESPYESGTIDKQYESTPETLLELEKKWRQASLEILELQKRINEIEREEKLIQKRNLEITLQISHLRELTQKAGALGSDNQEKKLTIKQVKRIAGGRPDPLDMVVSVSKFSITWRQIDNILDKLDEIASKLSQ